MSSSGLVAQPPTTAEHPERVRRGLMPRGWAHFALQVVLLGSFTFIYALMVMPNDLCDCRVVLDLGENLLANSRVLFHLTALLKG